MATDTREPADNANVVRVQIDPADLHGRPGDKVDMIARELAEGRRVELSPTEGAEAAPRRGPSAASLDRATKIVTVLGGGVVFGAASVAVAPASVVVAAVAAALGVIVTAIGTRFEEKHLRESTKAE